MILVHGVRKSKELAYMDILNNLNNDEVYSEVTKGKFKYFNTVTREDGQEKEELLNGLMIRNLECFESRRIDLKDRAMICGSEEMTFEIKKFLEILNH